MDKYKKLLSNSLIFTVGNFSSKFLIFVMLPIYTSVLEVNDFGTVDLYLSLMNIIVPILTLEFGQAILRFLIFYGEEKFNIILTNSIVFFIISLCVLVISFPIVKLFYSSENLVFFYLLIISTMVYNYANQFARGIGLTKEYAISGVFSTLITVISNIILLVVLDYGVDGYVISYILSYLLPFLYLSFCIISSIGINFKFSKDILIECLTFSIPLVPNAVLWWLINGANRLLILQYVGSVGNGIFAVANKLPMLLTLVTGIFLQAWQLSAYEEYGNSENIEYNRVVFKMYSQFLFLFGIGISIFSKLYFETFIDPRYNEAKSFVYLLILAVIFQSLSGFLGTIYTSARDTKGVLSSSSTGAAISIILSYFLTKSYGVLGSSIGTLIGFFVMYIFRLFDTKKFVDLTSEAKGVFFLSILILIQGLLNSFVSSRTSLLINFLICIIFCYFCRDTILTIFRFYRKSLNFIRAKQK